MDKTLIISVHGIYSNIDASDAWQLPFDNWLKQTYPVETASKDLVHLPFSYGVVGAVTSWFGLFKLSQMLAVRRYRKFLTAVATNYPGYKIHVVAHSFGTVLSQEVLYEEMAYIKIASLHLLGGVISAHIQNNYLDEMLLSNEIGYCVVWSSHNDEVARFAPPPFGHLGYWGIIRDYEAGDRNKPVWQPYEYLKLYNRPTECTHNSYFVPEIFQTWLKDILYEPQA
jgi:pimeloyl-ACP methyl ester carboxylesterase